MINYNVNFNEQTVVAYFEGGRDYWKDSLYKMCQKIVEYDNIPFYDIVDDVLYRYPVLIGKAVCSPDDTWSVSEGKRIAKQRLLDKWYRVKDSVLEELQEWIDKRYAVVTERIDKRLDRW